MSAPRCRKAVVAEDGFSVLVYYEGQECRVRPDGCIAGAWVAEVGEERNAWGGGRTIWEAVLECYSTSIYLMAEARP